MTTAFDEIIAQPIAVRVLTRAVKSGRIANSYLFEGPSGVGKSKAALALAQAVICLDKPGAGCGECEVCRRAAEGSHPDVRTFAPRDEGNRNIQVEFLRNEILPVAQFAPFEAKAAFLIFPEADVSFPEVHPESANALLKTLEEPRPGVHFVLLSERPDRLLPTIRSRCQNVRFARLPVAVLERILAEQGVPEAERGPAAALADGRADRALAMAESGTSQAVLERALAIDASVASRKPGSLVAIAEELARSDDLELTLETLSTFYRDVAAAGLSAPDQALAFRHRAGAIRERARVVTPAQAAARVELIRGTVDTFERNANRQSALDALLFGLGQA
jgi:DNA polymerase-3 subunit delta'